MAEQKVNFKLITPRRLLLSVAANMVVVPGGEGDFGVLPGHAPLLATVRPGVVEVYQGDRVDKRIFVSGGFAEVTGERCAVLAEEAVEVSEIDHAAAEERLAEANRTLEGTEDDTPERRAAERETATAEAMLATIAPDART